MRRAWAMRPEVCALLVEAGPRRCAPRRAGLVSCERERPVISVLRAGVLHDVHVPLVRCPAMPGWACEVGR